ncbi:MAG TPA: glycerate dehydrogenase [Gammaproteobacteria bacterium]|nr:glycerate dehydrogenase [Gammaproteobacteria bacterium]
MLRGITLDQDSYDRNDLDDARLAGSLEQWTHYPATRPDEVASRIAAAEVIITNKVRLGHEAIQAAHRTRLIVTAATGYNHIDLDAARTHNITVCNIVDYATPAVVQHTLALMTAMATRWHHYYQDVQNGIWAHSTQFCLLEHPIIELADKTLGIIGYGKLGQGVATVARALGMRVVLTARPGTASCPPERLRLQDLLPQVDVLSLHCPLTPETQHLIDANALGLMKQSAFLINTARGGIVDETALAAALRQGQIAAAAIDVLSTEPPSAGHPLLAPDIPNLIVTPHTAWASIETRQRLVDEIARVIEAWRRGQPINVVS